MARFDPFLFEKVREKLHLYLGNQKRSRKGTLRRRSSI